MNASVDEVRRKKDFYLQFFMHIKFKVAHLVKLANIIAIFSTKMQKQILFFAHFSYLSLNKDNFTLFTILREDQRF